MNVTVFCIVSEIAPRKIATLLYVQIPDPRDPKEAELECCQLCRLYSLGLFFIKWNYSAGDSGLGMGQVVRGYSRMSPCYETIGVASKWDLLSFCQLSWAFWFKIFPQRFTATCRCFFLFSVVLPSPLWLAAAAATADTASDSISWIKESNGYSSGGCFYCVSIYWFCCFILLFRLQRLSMNTAWCRDMLIVAHSIFSHKLRSELTVGRHVLSDNVNDMTRMQSHTYSLQVLVNNQRWYTNNHKTIENAVKSSGLHRITEADWFSSPSPFPFDTARSCFRNSCSGEKIRPHHILVVESEWTIGGIFFCLRLIKALF